MPVEAPPQAGHPPRPLAEQAAIDLARAMKNVSFYDVGHPVVQEVVGDVRRDLDALLGQDLELTMKLVSGYLVIQDTPLVGQHASIGNLVGACHRRGVEALVFQLGVTEDEVGQLVAVLAAEPAAVEEAGGPARALAARGVRKIAVERLRAQSEKSWLNVHAGSLDVMRGAARAVRRRQALDVGSIKLSVHDIVDDVLADRSIVYNLTSMKGMDEYTFIHALHLCILAVELGRQIGLPRERLEELGIATLLHDVGKIFVPLEILRKPAALDNSEFAVMSRHPVDGAAVLAGELNLPETAAIVAFEHHMHYDYSGYPRPRKRLPLHMYSLMASIVDVYDALTTLRPYRPALPPHRALEVIREHYAGRLEPRLLQHFLRMLGPYPWGTLLRLPEERLAVVTRPNPYASMHPFARAIDLDSPGAVIADEEVPLSEIADPDRVEAVDPADLGIDLVKLLQTAPPARGD